MIVERADFDDLVTLVSQAPPWEKDRAAGVADPAARDRRGEGERARPDPPALDVEARQGDAQDAGPPRQRRVPRGEAPARRGRELARAPARGERRPSSCRWRRRCRSRSAPRCSPRPTATRRARTGARPRPRGARRDRRDRERARRQPARAEGAGAQVAPPAQAEEDRRGPAAAAATARQRRGGGVRQRRRARRGTDQPRRPRRRRRRKPSGSAAGEAERRQPGPRRRRTGHARLERRRYRSGVLLLLAIGFVAGIVTALSPCVLPVLPIVLAGGATGRRPLAIVAGIVAQLHGLHALRGLAARPGSGCRRTCCGTSRSRCSSSSRVTLLSPRVAELLARPLQALTRRRAGDLGGGFLLGVEPRARLRPLRGPGARGGDGDRRASATSGSTASLLTLAYAVGAALPMLAIALRRAARRAARFAPAPRPSSAVPRASSSSSPRSRSRSASTRTCRRGSPATPRRCRSGSSAPTRRSASSGS